MDPYDEIFYRVMVGRLAFAIDRAVGRSADVFSYRLNTRPPGWTTLPHRDAHRSRKARARDLMSDSQCVALGTLDVRHYYPSILPDAMASVLAQTTAPTGAVSQVLDFLHRLNDTGAPAGLPVGPEASGLLGNLFLTDVDAALMHLVSGHVRYTDDSWVFLRAEDDWTPLVDQYESAAIALGLRLNRDKVAIHLKRDQNLQDVIQNDRIASMTAAGSPYVGPEQAVEELEDQLGAGDSIDWSVVRFALGALRRDRSTAGLTVLYGHPQIFREEPVNTARYLLELAGSKATRSAIDNDWIVDHCTESPTTRTLAKNVHACRVAHRVCVGKAHGERLEAVASDIKNRSHVPLQAWAATAWGSSDSHRAGQAIDHAQHVGDFSLRRAFALTIDPQKASARKLRKWCTHLMSIEPDLSPTLASLR